MILCPRCSSIMDITCVKPHKDKWEFRTYKCPKCGNTFELDVLPHSVDSIDEVINSRDG